MNRQSLQIVGAGLLGLVVAACLGYLALQLVSQPVGLSTVDAERRRRTGRHAEEGRAPAVKKNEAEEFREEAEGAGRRRRRTFRRRSSGDSGGDDSSSGATTRHGGDDSGGDDSGGDDHGGDDDD